MTGQVNGKNPDHQKLVTGLRVAFPEQTRLINDIREREKITPALIEKLEILRKGELEKLRVALLANKVNKIKEHEQKLWQITHQLIPAAERLSDSLWDARSIY
jgi:hypothetical protein